MSSSIPSQQSLKSQPSDFVDHGAPLPEGYGETRVVLLPRDPHWMFTYWEITEATAKEIKSKHGEDIFNRSQAVIRMHELSSPQHPESSIRTIDIGVSLEAKNWYLRADKQNSSWFVELGLKTADGKFILLARSNVITLPEGSVSTQMDEKWAYIKEEMDKIWEAAGGGKIGMGSLEMVKMLAQRGGWELLSQLSSWKGGISSGISSPHQRPLQQGERELQRGFWLMADCELILYGATEPTATLSVQGKPIELKPDGTFSLRFALPAGKLELPVKAVSGDRAEERAIQISVERTT